MLPTLSCLVVLSVGGVAALPGITDLAQGLRRSGQSFNTWSNGTAAPFIYSGVITGQLPRGQMSEVALLVQSALAGNDQLVSQIDSQPEPQQSVEVSVHVILSCSKSYINRKQRGQGSKGSSLNFWLTRLLEDLKWISLDSTQNRGPIGVIGVGGCGSSAVNRWSQKTLRCQLCCQHWCSSTGSTEAEQIQLGPKRHVD